MKIMYLRVVNLADPKAEPLRKFYLNDAFYDDQDKQIQILPVWSGRGKYPASDMFLKVASAKERSYHYSDNDKMFHLYMSEDKFNSLPTRIDQWDYSGLELFTYYTILPGIEIRLPVTYTALPEGFCHSPHGQYILARYLLKTIIEKNMSYKLYNLAEYAKASEFYDLIISAIKAGKIYVDITAKDNYITVLQKDGNELSAYVTLGHLQFNEYGLKYWFKNLDGLNVLQFDGIKILEQL